MIIVLLVLTLLLITALSFPVTFQLTMLNKKVTGEWQYLWWRKRSKPDKKEKTSATIPVSAAEQQTGKQTSTQIDSDKSEFPWQRFGWDHLGDAKRLLIHLISILKRLLRCFRFHDVSCFWQIGGEDPALTGALYGLAMSLLPVCPSSVDVEVVTDFVNQEWYWEANASVSVRPIMLLGWLFFELFRLPWMLLVRLYFSYRSMKRGIKQVEPVVGTQVALY